MNHGIARKRVMAEMEQVIDRLRLESAIVALGAMIRATVEMRNVALAPHRVSATAAAPSSMHSCPFGNGIRGDGDRYYRVECLASDSKPVGAATQVQEWEMTFGNLFARSGRVLAIGAALLAAVGLTTVPRPSHALSPGAGVGIGLGAFAAGTLLGAAANPYYNPYYYYPYGYYYAPAPVYYPPRPYYTQRSCWDPYYRRYYTC